MLLGNLIGCNSFGCRISALENDVSLLKQQVARMSGDPSGMMHNGMSGFRPANYNQYGQNQGTYNQQQGQQGQSGQQQGQQGQQGQQQQNTSGGGGGNQRVNQFAPDYQAFNQQQGLRRVPGYPDNQLNGQFIS